MKNNATDSEAPDVPEPEDTARIDQVVPDIVPAMDEPTYRIILPEIWMEISKHVRPEDVASFAGICKTTYNITRRASFWFHMYKKHGPKVQRFGKITVDVPMRLRPESMVRRGGLRACVIRTLFYTYPPFVRRLEINDRNLELTSFTRRFKVLQMWHVQMKPRLFAYFFRLEAPIPSTVIDGAFVQCRDPLRNVLDNPEEGRLILYVESKKYVPLPVQTFEQTQKKYLKAVTYRMSQGLRSYKVNMEFVLYNDAPYANLEIDPACLIKVWPWWHPSYHEIKNAGKYYIPPEDDFFFNL